MRVLIVVQRYGEEVVGGSEGHARIAARRLAARHEVEIATTTAVDFWTWGSYFPAGTTPVDGLPVHRFEVATGRDDRFKELALVRARFHNEEVPDLVLGIGLDPLPAGDPAAFRARHELAGPLVAYLGQVTVGKGCDELVADWVRYREAGGPGTLVLAGAVGMDIAPRPDIRVLGRISDAEKSDLLAAADVLVLPSHLESLGIVLLEAWQAGTPVLVPAWNAVTAGQVGRSGGGRTYATHDAFASELGLLLDGEGAERGAAGRAWVAEECAWPRFDERLDALVELAHG